MRCEEARECGLKDEREKNIRLVERNSTEKTQPLQKKPFFGFFNQKQDGSLPYFGVVVGRVANRISGAQFSLPDGSSVLLPANDNGRHCLHGGVVGWDKREWSVIEDEEDKGEAKEGGEGEGDNKKPPRSSVLLSLLSKDGDQGFPGNVRANVRYELVSGGKTLR